MLKRLKSVSMMLFLMGASSGAAYAVTTPSVTDVKITQQNGACTGIVLDSTGETVIGASVVVKGTTNGTITGFDGDFSLSGVKKGDIIVISFVGYTTQEVKWNGEPMKIVLQDDAQTLQEVVVTGYGGVQKAKTMTASASVVPMKTLAKLPVVSISEGLGGRVAGVITQQSSGQPGENAKIWVRGGSNILYVIDDVVMEKAQGEEFFNRLRPDDIASMSVLKDAAATAVYGPRAKDGVVVIATKRGQDGAPTITLNQKVSILTPAYRPEGLSSYEVALARNEIGFANFVESPVFNNEDLSKYYMGALWQSGHSQSEIMSMVNSKYGTSYTQQQIADLFDPFVTQKGNIQDYFSTYDPWEQFDHTQPMYQTNVSLRGGGERVKYYSSLGYLNQGGISDTYDYEQINFILNTDALLLSDKSLKFTFNVNGNTNTKKQPADNMVFNKVMYEWGSMPNRPAVWSTGKPRQNSPDAVLNTGFNNTDGYRFQMNAALKWNLPWVEGLSAQASLNYTHAYTMNKSFNHSQENVYDNPASTKPNDFDSNSARVNQSWFNYALTTGIFQVDYARQFGKHNVAAMVNYQSQVRRENTTNTSAYGYPTTFAPQIGLGGTKDGNNTGGSAVEWGSASWIGRITYDYDNKYLFQYSANYNGSLSYSPDKRWGYFHAASAGWNISEESWFKDLVNPKYLNMLKLRAGFGLVGSDEGISPFSYLTQYGQNGSRILFGANMTANVGWFEESVANDLEWVSSQQYNIGLDFEAFGGRFAGAFDAFLYVNKGDKMNMTSDLIRSDILGMPNIPQINAPYTTSKKGGYEFNVSWNDKIGKVEYRLGLTFSHWDQVVTRHTSENTNYYYTRYKEIGQRPWSQAPTYWYGYVASGLFASWDEMYNSTLHASRNQYTGTWKINDMNGSGVIGYGDFASTNAYGTTPLTQYGVTLGANWNGFDIELFFQGATQVDGATPSPIRGAEPYWWNYGQYCYQHAYMPSNPDVNAALPLPAANGYNNWGGNYIKNWLFDASYLKLKNLSIRYDLKKTVLKNVPSIQGCDLSFVATNLFTWTKSDYPLKGLQDPEFITSAANMHSNTGKLGSYPTQRSYTLGVTLTL